MNRTHMVIARRYAHAFLRVFPNALSPDALSRLYACADFFKERSHVGFFLDSSLLPHEYKHAGLLKIFDRFALSSDFLKLAELLVNHQRAFLLPQVLLSVVDRYKKQENIAVFIISSTQEIATEKRVMIEKFLYKKTQCRLLCSYMVDSRLIAGIRMQSSTYLWENSLQSRLRLLTNRLHY